MRAAQWLCANDRPDFKIRIEIVAMSDRDAFVARDRENSAHATASAIERGRSMRRALDEKFFKNQSELSTALKERRATVSTLVRLAEWPEEILAAFHTPFDILMVDAERLGPYVDDQACRGALLLEAQQIREDQLARKAAGKAPRARGAVRAALIRSVRPAAPKKTDICTVAKIGRLADGSRALVISIGLPIRSRMKVMSEVSDHLKNFHLIEPASGTDEREPTESYPLLDFIAVQSKDCEITTS